MQIGTVRTEEARVFDSRAGYHAFKFECPDCQDRQPNVYTCGTCDAVGELESGSFEVFWDDCDTGWYWWSCFPGCLPDSDPVGPFSSSIRAYYDAQEQD